jgi:hypothetical protein
MAMGSAREGQPAGSLRGLSARRPPRSYLIPDHAHGKDRADQIGRQARIDQQQSADDQSRLNGCSSHSCIATTWRGESGFWTI